MKAPGVGTYDEMALERAQSASSTSEGESPSDTSERPRNPLQWLGFAITLLRLNLRAGSIIIVTTWVTVEVMIR